MNDKELMQQALDALEAAYHPNDEVGKVMEAIKERLAQPEPSSNPCQLPEPEQTRSQKLRDAGITRRQKGWDKDGDEPDEDYEALANKQLASLKEAGKKTFEDAAVRALNKLYNAESDGISLKNITPPQTMAVAEDADINPDSLETVEIDLPEPESYPDNFIDALRFHTAVSEKFEPEPVAWRYALDSSVEGPRWIYIDRSPHQWLSEPAMANAVIQPLYASTQQQTETQKPIAWYVEGSLYASEEVAKRMSGNSYTMQPLYTASPRKEWHGLTDEEIESCRERAFNINNPYCPVDSKSMWKAYQYIEAKLKEKNNG